MLLVRRLGGGYVAPAPRRPERGTESFPENPLDEARRREASQEPSSSRRERGPAASPPRAAAAAPAPAAPSRPPRQPARKKALLGVAGAGAARGVAYGAYWALVLNHYESTDNAYVQGNVVQLTPQVAGTVVAIAADDTDFVKAGQTLVRLDPADARVALEQAEAQLAQTVRQSRTLFVNNGACGRRSRRARPTWRGRRATWRGPGRRGPARRRSSPPARSARKSSTTSRRSSRSRRRRSRRPNRARRRRASSSPRTSR
jgi:multidrug resistance efflux pump